MKKILIASAAALLAAPLVAMAHPGSDEGHNVYWHDSRGVYVTDGNGDCVRASDWRAGTQIEGCDEIMAKPMPMAKPMDSDGDGVIDANDQCPNTPAGVLVDRRGCALDSDKDGVPNYKDKCLRTPPGAKVDATGCQIAGKVLMEVNLDVNFATNSDIVTSAYQGDIKRVADFMKKADGSLAYIEGHTDSTGEASYNKDLSQRRAAAVADILVNDYGIARSRVKPEGYGESRPVADNKTKDGRRENRRVVAVIKGLVAK
ncbi:MAG: OmpA family protein [Motiliproteus sp.]